MRRALLEPPANDSSRVNIVRIRLASQRLVCALRSPDNAAWRSAVSPQQWLAITAAGIALGAAILGTLLLTLIERARSRNEKRLTEINRSLEFAHEYMDRARSKFQFAHILLALVAERDLITAGATRGEAMLNVLGGILDRNSAVTGGPPSEQQFRAWDAMRARAQAGDPSALADLSKTAEDLLNAWAKSNNDLVAERNGVQARARHLGGSSEIVRFGSITFQLMGLLIALLRTTMVP